MIIFIYKQKNEMIKQQHKNGFGPGPQNLLCDLKELPKDSIGLNKSRINVKELLNCQC